MIILFGPKAEIMEQFTVINFNYFNLEKMVVRNHFIIIVILN